MIVRRLALAVGLLFAGLGSQLPEFTQQYRQRLGGAVDELNAQVRQFDAEAEAQSMTRSQGIARLEANGDQLAQQRGTAMALMVKRKNRLEMQRLAYDAAGPVTQYAVLAEDVDRTIAGQALADYEPAFPATRAGFIAAAVAFVVGWLAMRLAALPLRRRRGRRPGAALAA